MQSSSPLEIAILIFGRGPGSERVNWLFVLLNCEMIIEKQTESRAQPTSFIKHRNSEKEREDRQLEKVSLFPNFSFTPNPEEPTDSIGIY